MQGTQTRDTARVRIYALILEYRRDKAVVWKNFARHSRSTVDTLQPDVSRRPSAGLNDSNESLGRGGGVLCHACRVILNTGVSSCEQVERERASKWIRVRCTPVKIGRVCLQRGCYGGCYDNERRRRLVRDRCYVMSDRRATVKFLVAGRF